MPKYPQTTLKAIRTGAKITLSLMDVDDYDYAVDYFIKEGVGDLERYGAIMYDLKRFELFLTDGKGGLPDDFMSFAGLYNGNFKYWIMDVQYANSCGCTGNFIDWSGVITIDGNCIDTNSNFGGKTCLLYKAYYTNTDGDKLIPQYAERALRNYAAAEFGATRNTMYSPSQVAGWKRDWVAQKPALKGFIWQEYFEEHKQRLKQWIKALIPDQSNILQ